MLFLLISTLEDRGASGETASRSELAELASGARERDPEALARLFDIFFEKLRRYAYYKTGDLDWAEDLASETLAKGMESIDRFSDRGGTIGAWFFGIARNLIARRREELGRAQLQDLDSVLTTDTGELTEDVVLSRMTHEELYAALSKLPEDQREVILLRFMEGYGAGDVGIIMGRRPGAVRALQFRALRALRQVLSSTGDGEDE